MGWNWTKADLPTGSAHTIRIADNTWYSRCQACDYEVTVTANYPAPRYMTVGPHEVKAHGLQVAGINVGLLA